MPWDATELETATLMCLKPFSVENLCFTLAGIVSDNRLLQREGDASQGVKVRPGCPGRGGVVGPVTPSASSQPILKEHADDSHHRKAAIRRSSSLFHLQGRRYHAPEHGVRDAVKKTWARCPLAKGFSKAM